MAVFGRRHLPPGGPVLVPMAAAAAAGRLPARRDAYAMAMRRLAGSAIVALIVALILGGSQTSGLWRWLIWSVAAFIVGGCIAEWTEST